MNYDTLPKEKKNKQAYSLVNEAIEKKILEAENGVTYCFSPQYCDSNTPL